MSGSISVMLLPCAATVRKYVPLKINLHELLLDNRHEAVAEGNSSFAERMAWKMWRQASLQQAVDESRKRENEKLDR